MIEPDAKNNSKTKAKTESEPKTQTEATSDIDRLVGLIQSQQETIDYLVQYIERVEAQVNDRLDAVDNNVVKAHDSVLPPGKYPVNWANVAPDTAVATRQALADFVDFLVDRHGFRDHLRPCWYEHGTAVEELTALWTARAAAFAGNADASMASWWQDLLERSQFRLRKMFVKCRNGHVSVDASPWLSPEEREHRDRWVRGEPLDTFE